MIMVEKSLQCIAIECQSDVTLHNRESLATVRRIVIAISRSDVYNWESLGTSLLII